MSAAAPRLLDARERCPPPVPVAPLRANQSALRIEPVDNDVMEEVEVLAGGVDHLQHQDHRPSGPQLVLDEVRRAGDELRVEALLPRRHEHVDGHDSAARLRQRVFPCCERRRLAVVLQDGGERTGAARLDPPGEHRDVRDDAGGGGGGLRAGCDRGARREPDREEGEDYPRAMMRMTAAAAPIPIHTHS